MKAVRYILLALLGLVVLAVIAIGVAFFVIDPNAYKPQIEKVVEDQTNLDLNLAGDISWSLIPLGLEINEVEATLDNERFVALELLVAEVNFWSLLAMSPQVNTFVLEGLDARLQVAKDGTGNWTRIMPEGTPAEAPAQPAEPAPEPAPEEAAAQTPLAFEVEEVRISNAQVHYDDMSTGQSVVLEDFTLTASDIALGQSFPLNVGFRFATGQPEFNVVADISASLSANEALDTFAVSGLDSSFDLSGEPFTGKTVQAGLTGSINANLNDETASLQNLEASLANLTLTTNLEVAGFGDQPKLSGSLSIAEFSLRQLLDSMGQPAIETADPDVLKALAFSTDIGGPAGTVELSNLNLKVDDSSFTGGASYGLAKGAIALNLQGDKFNADRYLPPASEEEAAAETAGNGEQAPQQPAGETAETDLLPLETLRDLALNINLGLGELIVSNLTITELKNRVTADAGLIKLNEFSAKLYDGSINANATLDARSDNPKWSVSKNITNVQTLPLLTDLAEVELLAGGANINTNVTTQGNRMSALRGNADGEINFNLAEGQFTRMNLTRMACQGIALVNGESLTTTDWGTGTPFNDMKGTMKIDGNMLDNTELVAALAGMKLEGAGTVNLTSEMLDYQIGLRVVGEIHRDEACRVTEYVKGAVIPVECKGNFADDPAGLCSFDGSRFRDTLKDMAAKAAKSKAKEEVNKAVEEKLDKALEGKGGEQVKDALKGLFGR
ncbi:MAG: AsmA family protein [Marinobacter sp.]|uniref:AsmA family protein n=1 Tax=Marinobacter sp. TaxID=50741 RepID=UPI00299DC3C1|nr:AsmA family protein [Marinobacter sp.]MDX1633998.1 AsmA family protein [Marinobacter sp.]